MNGAEHPAYYSETVVITAMKRESELALNLARLGMRRTSDSPLRLKLIAGRGGWVP